jgi:hypothetical protein
MGAALTYARRYALFTLVGIAGETAASLRKEVVIFVPTPNMKGLRRILKREPLQQPSSLRRYLPTYTGVEALSLLMKNIPR